MKSNYINLQTHPLAVAHGGGNYNYGMFCGRQDTLAEAKGFVRELLDKFGVTSKEEIETILSDLEARCEIKTK